MRDEEYFENGGGSAPSCKGGPDVGEIAVRLKSFSSGNLGLSFFLAWSYMTVFTSSVYTGEGDPFGIERLWMVSAAVQVVAALIGLALGRAGKLRAGKGWGIVSAVAAVAGNVALWLCFKGPDLYWTLLPFTGIAIGISMASFSVMWGARLARCDYSQIEFDVLGSFAIAFALYCITLPMKLNGIPQLIIASILPIASAWLALRSGGQDASCEDERATRSYAQPHARETLRGNGSTFVMMGSLWVIAAFLRVIYTPYGASDTFVHYFAPFFLACIASIVLFGALVWIARHINVTLAFRWAIPFFLASLAAVCFDPFNIRCYSVAYTLNYLGMFGVQVSLWMAMAKFGRRNPGAAPLVFMGYLVASGVGIMAGGALGSMAWEQFAGTQRLAVSLVVLSLCAFLALLLGFSPHWRTPGIVKRVVKAGSTDADEPAKQGEAASPSADAAATTGGQADATAAKDSDGALGEAFSRLSDEEMLSLLIRNKARALKQEFGLTARETEIAELLLAGRSRPYIRDELMISLNTVHTHASNIFSKCGVHSQQELIDLARG